jgi:hypothetical protein
MTLAFGGTFGGTAVLYVAIRKCTHLGNLLKVMSFMIHVLFRQREPVRGQVQLISLWEEHHFLRAYSMIYFPVGVKKVQVPMCWEVCYKHVKCDTWCMCGCYRS